MKSIIVLSFVSLLSVFVYANDPQVLKSTGGYDWNNFVSEVQTTINDIQLKKEKVEKEIESEPKNHSQQADDVDKMITRIMLVQDMIDHEYQYRSELDQSQKDALERYKNQALRLRQELMALRQKLKGL